MVMFVSAIKAHHMIERDSEEYLAVVFNMKQELSKPVDNPVASEFADVFPEELSGLPPTRDVDFVIDDVPGTEPISKALYQM